MNYEPNEVVVKYIGEEPKLVKVQNVYEQVKELSKNPMVEFAEPNYIVKALGVPNDFLYQYQWSFHKEYVNAEEAWELSTGEGITVAVIDTGVAYERLNRLRGDDCDGGEPIKKDHCNDYYKATDFTNTKFVEGYDFVNDDSHANDDHSHGTHVTGTIASTTNDGVGTAGIAPDVTIMPIKVLNDDGRGTNMKVFRGIMFAVDNGADVINLSLGGGENSVLMQRAVNYAREKGVILVAASGNQFNTWVLYPAAYSEVIAVSSIRVDKQMAFYSSYGEEIFICAPGGSTRYDWNNDGIKDGILQNTYRHLTPSDFSDFEYRPFQGTSMAAPHVTGVIALLLSDGYVETEEEVREVLRLSAEDLGTHGWDSQYGWGLVKAYEALITARRLKNVSPTNNRKNPIDIQPVLGE